MLPRQPDNLERQNYTIGFSLSHGLLEILIIGLCESYRDRGNKDPKEGLWENSQISEF